ncbi:hypothetical protein JCM10212_002958 [Sporobolomyces blumeae]
MPFSSPLFRRRLSTSHATSSTDSTRAARPSSPLDFKDPSIVSSPSSYFASPPYTPRPLTIGDLGAYRGGGRSDEFVSVPVHDDRLEDGALRPSAPKKLQVPLTPRADVLHDRARFGRQLGSESTGRAVVVGKRASAARNVSVAVDPTRGEARPVVGPVTLWERFRVWLVFDGPQWSSLAVWIVLQALVIAFGCVNYALKDNLTTGALMTRSSPSQSQTSDTHDPARSTFGTTFVLARSAALVLHVDIACILLPICRGFVSWLRRSTLNELVPFEKNIEFHKLVAWSVVFWTIVHTAAHLVNFWLLSVVLSPTPGGRVVAYLTANLTTGPGATGWLMIAFLAVMVYFALESRRRKHFERFYYSHHLFVAFFVCWQLHGMFCMIKPDRPPYCSSILIGVFWKYALPSLTVYVAERILREIRSRHRTWITTVIQHPASVVELQFKKEQTTIAAGQYILLNCPQVSYFQWHPFSITSAPEEDFISVHIRIVGDFTRAFAEILGCRLSGRSEPDGEGAQVVEHARTRVLPRIMVDGPFGSASEDVFDFEVSVLVAGGIGVTPFASVLKHIWYRLNSDGRDSTRLSKVYFFWVCRDFTSFEWFQSLLMALEAQDTRGHIEIHTYLTCPLKLDQVNNIVTNGVGAEEDALTKLRAPTHYGRPNWNVLFPSIAQAHRDVREIGVFFCGPKPLAGQLEKCCKTFSQPGEDGTRFVWRKENF